MFAIAALSSWEKEDIRVVSLEVVGLGSYDLKLNDVVEVRGPNYFSTMGIVGFKRGSELITLKPEKRNYPIAQMPTTEAAIDYRILEIYTLFWVINNQKMLGPLEPT